MSSTLKPKTEYEVELKSFKGGLNLRDADYCLSADESPEMKNMLWRNGFLASRRGQCYLAQMPVSTGTVLFDTPIGRNVTTGTVLFDTPIDSKETLSTVADILEETSSASLYAQLDRNVLNDSKNVSTGTVLFDTPIDSKETLSTVADISEETSSASLYAQSDRSVLNDNKNVSNRTVPTDTSAHAMYNGVWHGYLFAHIGLKLYAISVADGTYTELATVPQEVPGTWFMYGGALYYKSYAIYKKITATEVTGGNPEAGAPCKEATGGNSEADTPCKEATGGNSEADTPCEESTGGNSEAYTPCKEATGENSEADTPCKEAQAAGSASGAKPGTSIELNNWTFTCTNVIPYVPVIVMNASYVDGSGDLYQPENRYSPQKTVWFNAASGVTQFKLPVVADYIVKVVVDGVVKTSGWTYNYTTGVVTFSVAPPVTTPPTNNTVRITYSKSNITAYNSVNFARFAAVHGSVGELCVVMAGSELQRNAYFWSGNSDVAMDPGYFPMEQYQIAGETENPITGFGKQQSNLIVFQETAIGKASLGVAEINGRNSIEMPYVPINAKIGCDKPWTIQLIENNLVWANSNGVYTLLDTTEANENFIVCISEKINGTPPNSQRAGLNDAPVSTEADNRYNDGEVGTMQVGTAPARAVLNDAPTRAGLIYDLSLSDTDSVCAVDDERRYWLICNGHAWVWDYKLSKYSDPSWFYLDGINGISVACGNGYASAVNAENGNYIGSLRVSNTGNCGSRIGNSSGIGETGGTNEIYQLLSNGSVVKFQDAFNDFGSAFSRVFRTPVQTFGELDRLKNVNSVIFALCADNLTKTDVEYITDYGTFIHPEDLKVVSSESYEENKVPGTRPVCQEQMAVFRRRPMCRRVIHFAIRLSDANINEDMSIVGVRIFFEKMGRLR